MKHKGKQLLKQVKIKYVSGEIDENGKSLVKRKHGWKK